MYPLATRYLIAVLLITLHAPSCNQANDSLTKGLEEEKSYTRHAMEYHRQHPEKRRGDSVLGTWSTMDYIGQAVANQKRQGNWVDTSDKLSYLSASLRHDSAGRPFCVAQENDTIVVVTMLSGNTSAYCTEEKIKALDLSKIQSGDMDFSGRSEHWIYVLRLSNPSH